VLWRLLGYVETLARGLRLLAFRPLLEDVAAKGPLRDLNLGWPLHHSLQTGARLESAAIQVTSARLALDLGVL
jgi:hypothetical protein